MLVDVQMCLKFNFYVTDILVMSTMLVQCWQTLVKHLGINICTTLGTNLGTMLGTNVGTMFQTIIA